MFEKALADVAALEREEAGVGESPREKFDRMAREKLAAGAGQRRSSWWGTETSGATTT